MLLLLDTVPGTCPQQHQLSAPSPTKQAFMFYPSKSTHLGEAPGRGFYCKMLLHLSKDSWQETLPAGNLRSTSGLPFTSSCLDLKAKIYVLELFARCYGVVSQELKL